MMNPSPGIVLSNGFSRYNLVVAATELARRGMLVRFVTGAYPAGPVWRLVCWCGLDRGRKLARLAGRAGDIPESRIEALWRPEAVQVAGGLLKRVPLLARLGDRIDVAGYRHYARAAADIIRRVGHEANLYHYRSGFGGPSVDLARRRGMVALCEHTIAHPCLVEHLVAHGGQFPPTGASPRPNRFWRNVLADVDRADHVLVNSDFVKRTFLHQGWPAERVHVIDLGVDEAFFEALPPRTKPVDGPLQLLFAGGLEPRKGADILAEALSGCDDIPWRLSIAGGIAPEIRHRHAAFLADPRVRTLGFLPRPDLAHRMARADVFVFPSLAEGSARVVFEALAAGCFVVTTANAGSIVEDERHGFLVPPGDAGALRAAIRRAFDRGAERTAIGAANAALVRDRFTPVQYGDALERLYGVLLR